MTKRGKQSEKVEGRERERKIIKKRRASERELERERKERKGELV